MKNSCLRIIHCLALLGVTAVGLAGYRLVGQEASQTSDDRVYDVRKAGDYGVKPPKAIYSPNPEYTDKACRKKLMAWLWLGLS